MARTVTHKAFSLEEMKRSLLHLKGGGGLVVMEADLGPEGFRFKSTTVPVAHKK